MNRVEIKKLPNNVKLSAYFNNSPNSSIQKIEALKSVYVESIEKNCIEKKDLVLNLEKVEDKNTTFKEQILFNGKSTGVAEVYYMYSFSPQKFNKNTRHYENYKWVRIKDHPTLLQVWKKPLEYIKIKEFIKLFYGFDEKNPIKISYNNIDFTQEKPDIENLDTLLKIAKNDGNLGQFQEYCGYKEEYFNRFRRDYNR